MMATTTTGRPPRSRAPVQGPPPPWGLALDDAGQPLAVDDHNQPITWAQMPTLDQIQTWIAEQEAFTRLPGHDCATHDGDPCY